MYGAVVLQMWLSKRIVSKRLYLKVWSSLSLEPFFSPEGEDRGVMFDMYQLVEYPVVADFLSSVRLYLPSLLANALTSYIFLDHPCPGGLEALYPND